MPNKEMCTRCNREEAQPEHKCPYSVEMRYNENYEDLPDCNCCNDCESTCAGDI